MKRVFYLLGAILIVTLLTGCAADNSSVPTNYRWANVEGSQLNETQAGEQFYFNILVDEGMIRADTPIKIKLSGNVESGSLRFELRDPQGQAVWNSGTIEAGDFSIQTEYSLPAGRTGTYQLGMVYAENTSATYNLGWHAIKLGPSVLLSGLGMVVVSLAFVIYAARKKILGWKHLAKGALFWMLTVTVKFLFAIPVNPILFRVLGVSYENIFSPANLVYYLYVGALTGIFEAGLAWLILSKTRWGKADWNQALVFGIGFGVVEAFLLGLTSLASALVAMLSPDTLPISALGGLANNATLSMALAPIGERLFVIFAHIFACVVIFHAIKSRESKWGWLAILYKTLLDAPAGFAAFWGVGAAAKLWTIEGTIAVLGLIGLWGTIQIARRYVQRLVPASASNTTD